MEGGPPPAPPSSSLGDAPSAPAALDLPSNRFELELEFIQCLASPAYLHHLATSGLFSDKSFMSFLDYLGYWRRPEYARFLTYPHCLYFLDLVTSSEAFRREMANVGFRNFVHEQQFYGWQFRSRHLYGSGATETAGAGSDEGGASGGGGGGGGSDGNVGGELMVSEAAGGDAGGSAAA